MGIRDQGNHDPGATTVEAVPSQVSRGPLYCPPWPLIAFQVEHLAQAYERDENLVIWDTGLGKGTFAECLSCLLVEDGKIDHILVCAQMDKLDEWTDDFAEHTALTVGEYHGQSRSKLLGNLPQVLVSTYETFSADLGPVKKTHIGPRGGKKEIKVWGALGEALEGRRVLLVWDEVSAKLTNRSSGLYKRWEWILGNMRRDGRVRLSVLDATPAGAGPEGLFNVLRLVYPQAMPTVAEWGERYVKGTDFFGNVTSYKNLSHDDANRESWVTPFSDLYAPITLRKRKTDPDVAHLFPVADVRPPIWVTLGDRHYDFYETVRETFEDADERTQASLLITLRQIANHPLSILHSQTEVAEIIKDKVGEAGLRALGSAKEDALVAYLRERRGEQTIVFSFFGRSTFPFLVQRLLDEGIDAITHDGTMTKMQKRNARARFKAGEGEVFLTSDTGARGINLPNASAILEYEMALTASNRTQRFNRASRMLSGRETLAMDSLVAAWTAEEGIARNVLRGEGWNDQLLNADDPGNKMINAAVRKQLFRIGRPPKPRG